MRISILSSLIIALLATSLAGCQISKGGTATESKLNSIAVNAKDQKELCKVLKRKQMYNKVNPNPSGETISKSANKKLRDLLVKHNCHQVLKND